MVQKYQNMDPLYLKEATREAHQRTESGMRLMDADLTAERYVAYLKRFYGIIASWEKYAAEHAPAALREAVAERRRADSLVADLADFNAKPPAEVAVIPEFGSLAEFVGAMYVIEGSTLGGQYIARHVEEVLHLTSGFGNRYFLGYRDKTGAMWQQFRQIVASVPDSDSDCVVGAARTMFQIFDEWMKPAA